MVETRAYMTLRPLLKMSLGAGVDVDLYIENLVNATLPIVNRLSFIIRHILMPVEKHDIERFRYVVETLIRA